MKSAAFLASQNTALRDRLTMVTKVKEHMEFISGGSRIIRFDLYKFLNSSVVSKNSE